MAKGLWVALCFSILVVGLLPPACRGQVVNLDITSSRVSFGVWSFKEYIRDPSVHRILLAGVVVFKGLLSCPAKDAITKWFGENR